MTIRIDIAHELGEYISSRAAAADLRERVIENAPAILDFSRVVTLSDSFADEFFAVLVCERGEKWFAKNVRVEGLSGDPRYYALRAIHSRCAVVAS